MKEQTPMQDELDRLREWHADAPPLDEDTRHRARVRLFAAINEQPSSVRPLWRRPVLRILATGVVTAAVAATVLVSVDSGPQGGPQAKPPASSAPPMANVSAQTVLNGAAAWERKHEKPAAPRDDQFIYTKEIIKETDDKTGETKTHVDEIWRSVDGSQRSWIMEIGKGWWSEPLKKNESVWPPQDWGTLEKLPTDPEKLILSRLYRSSADDKNDSLDGITDEEWSSVHFDLAGLLKLVPVMPEGLRPAAYEALGMIPGVRTVPDQRDAKGRTGIAITYDDPTLPEGVAGWGGYFIFDPETYEFLGFRDERTSGDGPGMKRYTQLSYLDSWAITDKAKQRP
ncbi:CU044_5270 family protein [Streptomyces sp. TRM66268-LWL]|uniref:CU044_5270 family protein n=1 Tax=Streptomyces polyasparticus TaxID=2767826 RepID=A0ABR7SC04_9ACTN|nr:CU044_5270 family protein [Streptomyces polyasparticus]MBC9712270.1 CU044_5270 family protein [Streptomyces polyasparticus]